MRLLFLSLSLLLATLSARAQQVRVPDLLHCLSTTADDFDACMFRKGFVCYQSRGGLNGWTCLFAYRTSPLAPDPSTAPALVQYDRNSRSDILTYQVRSKQQYQRLCRELRRLGYYLDPAFTDREQFVSARSSNLTVSCQPATTTTGMSGNYGGYLFTLTKRRY